MKSFKEFLTESNVYYHGSSKKHKSFDSSQPTFLTKDEKYAKNIGRHVHTITAKSGKTKKMEYHKVSTSSIAKAKREGHRYVSYKIGKIHTKVSLYPHEDLKIH